MVRKLAGIAALAALALVLLAGCDVAGGSTNAIIGSISMDLNASEASGGLDYHVLVYEGTESVNPTIASTVNGLTTVAHLDGTFPGSMGDWYWTTNYVLANVPAGQYYLFVWIDWDSSGDFDEDLDACGFYDGNMSGNAIRSEPWSPNITVPAAGLLDIDVLCGFKPVT
jgi:hypothetical protein